MSGGNQQKAIVAREIDRDPDVLIAVQPTRGLDVGAIEYIHGKLVEERDAGKALSLIHISPRRRARSGAGNGCFGSIAAGRAPQ